MTNNSKKNLPEQGTKRGFAALIGYGWLMAVAGILLLSDVSWHWSFSPFVTTLSLAMAGFIVVLNARYIPDLWGSMTQIYSFGVMALIASGVLAICAVIPFEQACLLISAAMGLAGLGNLGAVLFSRTLDGRGMMALSGVFWLAMAALTATLGNERDAWILMIVLSVYACVKGVYAIFIAALVATENHDKNYSGLFKS